MIESALNNNNGSKTRKIISFDLSQIAESVVDTESIPKGDMPGDKISIGSDHIRKAQILLPRLAELLEPILNGHPHQKAVVVVCGGSGVGKSEIASLLSYYLNSLGVGSYTLSGDNYPNRIPMYNDAERLHIFRQSGIKGLIAQGSYDAEKYNVLKNLQMSGNDSNPEYTKEYPWLSVYQDAGRCGLRNYLGSMNEINFGELTEIISQFKNGQDRIFLKRMGRDECALWYDEVDFSDKNVMIIEWTHGNSFNLKGVDIPILLNSTPQETLEHRRKRNRDGGTDSSFTTMVLSIEQDMLISQAPRAKIILSKNCELLSYRDYQKIMTQDQIQEEKDNG